MKASACVGVVSLALFLSSCDAFVQFGSRIDELRAAVQRDQSNVELRYQLAEEYYWFAQRDVVSFSLVNKYRMGVKLAQEECDEIFRRDPQYARAYILKGLLSSQSRGEASWRQSLEYLKRAAEVDQALPDPHCAMYEVYLRLEQHKSALSALEACIGRLKEPYTPHLPVLSQRLASDYMMDAAELAWRHLKDRERALKWLRRAVESGLGTWHDWYFSDQSSTFQGLNGDPSFRELAEEVGRKHKDIPSMPMTFQGRSDK